MNKNNPLYFILLFLPLAGVLFFLGCSHRSDETVSGIWRADDALPYKNLVIEFGPDGSGKVFSGSIIGFPTDASFKWQMKGDQITIETRGDDPVTQIMTLVSQEENSLTVEVNRTELKLVRIEGLIDEDTGQLLSTGGGEETVKFQDELDL